MRKLTLWFNNLILFDPSKWPYRELLSKWAAILIVMYLIYSKMDAFLQFPGSLKSVTLFYLNINQEIGIKAFSITDIQFIWMLRLIIWCLETGILVGYVVAYIVRIQAVAVAKGFMEVAFPFVVAVIPIIISYTPYNFPRNVPYGSGCYILCYAATAILMIVGGTVNLLGLWTLRKSFTIMTEARGLITHGIFRIVRHPLYIGHFIMFFGSLAIRLHWYTILLYAGFVGGQVLRAGIEEKKLMETFPGLYPLQKDNPHVFSTKIILVYQKMILQ